MRRLGTTNGLSARVVPSLLVDRNGFLWVGSREGLYRYDGYSTVRYLPDPTDADSISDLDIRTLYEDQHGVLWISTNTGGLNRYNDAEDSFTVFRHDSKDPSTLSSDSTYGMAEGPNGGLWIGSQTGLNRLNRETGEIKTYFHQPDEPGSLPGNWTYCLLRDASGSLWVGTVGSGLARWIPEQQRFVHYDLVELSGGPIDVNDVFTLSEDSQGGLWIGTRNGLIHADPKRQTFTRLDLLDGEDEPLITASHLGEDDRLLITTIAHGLVMVDTISGQFRWLDDTTTPGTTLMSIVRSGRSMFVGTWGDGVFFGREVDLEFDWLTNETAALRNENVTAVLATDEPGRPWVGTFGGGPQRLDLASGRAAVLSGETSALWTEGVQSFARLDTNLFLGTTDALWWLDSEGSVIRRFEYGPGDESGLGEGYVTGLLAQDEDLWVGVGGSGLHRLSLETGRFTAYRHDPERTDSLSGDYVTCLLAAGDGRLWVGTRSNGLNLCQIEPWSCRHLESPDRAGLPERHHVTTLFRDHRGDLWVGTSSGGVFRQPAGATSDATSFQRLTQADGLVSNSVMGIAEEDDGTLWITTREGLSRIDRQRDRIFSFDVETGLPSGHFNASAATADAAALYFGSVSGLLVVPKGQPMPQRQPAPLRITELSKHRDAAATQPPWLRSEHAIDYGDPLAIEFAVLDYSERPHSYRYRLSPNDEWIELGSRHEVTLYELPPGEYRFEVRGRDVFGLWSEAPAIQLAVVPPFWMTGWFRTLMFALLAGSIALAHTLRLRHLERRNQELSRLKEQREAALELAEERAQELEASSEGLARLARRLESAKEDERQHLSRELHDQLGQSLTAAKISLQLLPSNGTGGNSVGPVEETIGMIDTMIGQVRAISLDLRPPLLDEAGLVPALTSELDRLAHTTGIEILQRIATDLPPLSPKVETVLFRVVQEAVNNALKHAGAQRIEIELSAAGGTIEALVSDDGRGFDLERTEQRILHGEHLGLLGIRERLRDIGGRLEIESSSGRGTRLRATVDP